MLSFKSLNFGGWAWRYRERERPRACVLLCTMHVYRGLTTALWSSFSPSTLTWVLGIEPQLCSEHLYLFSHLHSPDLKSFWTFVCYYSYTIQLF